MMGRMGRYPQYSLVNGLGSVPAHWDVKSLGSIAITRTERNQPKLPLLSVLREKGVVLRSTLRDNENHNFIPDDLSNYKVVRTGDLVINKMKAWQGSMGISQWDGIVSPAYFVFKLAIQNSNFSSRLLRSQPYVSFFARASDGVRVGQWDLSIADMKRIPALIPPLEEQHKIAAFLTLFDHRINRLIRSKRRLIALLEEQKQAIIQMAVSRGLNPSAPVQSSGIESLGDLPRHWSTTTVRRVISLITSGSRGWAAFYSDDGEIFVQSGNLGRSLALDLTRLQRVKLPRNAEGSRTLVRRHDVLLCITGALTGNVVIVDEDMPNAYVNQHVALLRVLPDAVNPRFLAYVLYSPIGQLQFKNAEYGGTKQGLGLDEVKSVSIPLPPRDEQDSIVAHLDVSLRSLQSIVASADKQIALLREYRTRLVADVVTGQLDVRGVSLPPLSDSENEDQAVEFAPDLDDSDDADMLEAAESLDPGGGD